MAHLLDLTVISVQNLSDPDEQKRLLHAAQSVGFVRLAGFTEQQGFGRIFELANLFFEMSEEQKLTVATQAYVPTNPNCYRGYFPSLQDANALKEAFEIGPPGEPLGTGILYEKNCYPQSLPSTWRRDIEVYYNDMRNLGMLILSAFEQGFELPDGRLTERFVNGISTLRLIHYPKGVNETKATVSKQDGGFFSTPAHVDSGILTLLLQDDTGGLQARLSSGEWVDIVPIQNTLVMNLGALLETLTDGRVKATEHRVKMPTRSRFSIPFFMEPAADAEVSNLFDGEKSYEFENYQAYLFHHMSDFIEYKNLIERLK